MSITAPDSRVDGLSDPDWRAFEDSLAPICEELAARFASVYDEDRRRRDFDERLAQIRRRDAEERAALAAASPVHAHEVVTPVYDGAQSPFAY